MRSVFVGDVTAGRPIIETLRSVGEVVAIAIDHDRHKARAEAFDTTTLAASALNQASVLDQLGEFRTDLIVNFNSTVIFSGSLLQCPRIGSINFHPGLLPEYAGLNVHQWAILNGETTTGVTIHVMTETVDAGAVLAEKRVAIEDNDTGLTLYMKLLRIGAGLMPEVVSAVSRGGFGHAKPQTQGVRHLYRRSDRPAGRIDFNQPAQSIRRFVRALSYRPMISPLGAPYLSGPSGDLEVVSVSILDGIRSGNDAIGRVIDIQATGITIGCQDGAVRIDRIHSERPKEDPETAANRVGVKVGSVV